MRRTLSLLLSTVLASAALFMAPAASWAYPFWAQQNYESPREATGKLVCANCHLAKLPTQVEVPQAVMPDTVFKAVVKIPYDTSLQQVRRHVRQGAYFDHLPGLEGYALREALL